MRSLTYKLTLAFLLVGLTGALLVAVILGYRTRLAFSQFILNREQEDLVANLVEYYELNGSWQGIGEALPSLMNLPDPQSDPSERHIPHDWMGMTLVGPDRKIVSSPIPGRLGQTVSNRDLDKAISFKLGNETIGWLMQPSNPREWTPDSPEDRFLQNINSAVLLSALGAMALALILGGLLAFTMTRSLRELTDATLDIARGVLGRQVKVRTKDELGELATSFNKMSLDLARATHARRQMTADIAHDLRSPLSVLTGYAEALSDGKLPGTPEIYEILYQETRHLGRLVDDLRLLSLADAGELSLVLQPVDARGFLERVAARHTVTAQQKEVALKVETVGELPAVPMDVERMAQVFDNLVLNAFRYTPQGGEVGLDARPVNGSVQFRVRDNGQGVAPEDLPHIFDRFYRGDKARQQTGESGLGLAIARSIVEAHGGTISVDSRPGEGATFTINLRTQT